jgi:UDP-N-acetylglucosamine 2-epimerase (non-hydrolysing)
VVAEVSRLLTEPEAYAAMAKGGSPYGDGHAAERIAALVADAVHARPHPPRPADAIRLPGVAAATTRPGEAAAPPPVMPQPVPNGPVAP